MRGSFNRRSISALFEPAHWDLVTYRTHAKGISLRNGLHILGVDLPDGYTAGSAAAWLGRLTVPYRLGDLVWVVLRRRSDAA